MLNILPLNTENTINNNKPEEIVLDLDLNNDNEKNLLLKPDNNKPIKKVSKGVIFSLTGELPKKIEDSIICFSRRRKWPKHNEDLTGFFVTLSFFIIFTILMTICLSFCKKISEIPDYLKTLYNYIILFIWITSINAILLLVDAATADPGRQRGYPISESKFKRSRIKKIVGGKKYALKYCVTCHLIRDIRTHHCDTCGLCIEKHDHHCGYLSNCVGVYNYRKFFMFLIAACIHVSIIFLTCCHIIVYYPNLKNLQYEWIVLLVTIILIFGGFFEIFTVWMVCQHIVTIVQNRTTREFIKKKEYGIYNKGCKENCKEALCSNSIKEL